MVDAVAVAIAVILVLAVVQLVTPWIRRAGEKVARARAPHPARAGGHEELATTRGLPVLDATRVGCPERIWRKRSRE